MTRASIACSLGVGSAWLTACSRSDQVWSAYCWRVAISVLLLLRWRSCGHKVHCCFEEWILGSRRLHTCTRGVELIGGGWRWHLPLLWHGRRHCRWCHFLLALGGGEGVVELGLLHTCWWHAFWPIFLLLLCRCRSRCCEWVSLFMTLRAVLNLLLLLLLLQLLAGVVVSLLMLFAFRLRLHNITARLERCSLGNLLDWERIVAWLLLMIMIVVLATAIQSSWGLIAIVIIELLLLMRHERLSSVSILEIRGRQAFRRVGRLLVILMLFLRGILIPLLLLWLRLVVVALVVLVMMLIMALVTIETLLLLLVRICTSYMVLGGVKGSTVISCIIVTEIVSLLVLLMLVLLHLILAISITLLVIVASITIAVPTTIPIILPTITIFIGIVFIENGILLVSVVIVFTSLPLRSFILLIALLSWFLALILLVLLLWWILLPILISLLKASLICSPILLISIVGLVVATIEATILLITSLDSIVIKLPLGVLLLSVVNTIFLLLMILLLISLIRLLLIIILLVFRAHFNLLVCRSFLLRSLRRWLSLLWWRLLNLWRDLIVALFVITLFLFLLLLSLLLISFLFIFPEKLIRFTQIRVRTTLALVMITSLFIESGYQWSYFRA